MFTVLTNFLLCRKSSNGKQTENVEWRRLRQFATTSDIVALIVGCICSAIGGILQNMVLFLGGKVTTVFIQHGKPSDPELLSGALFYLICLAASGVGELIATFIEMYCFAHFVDNLVRRLRKDYMSAVTHKDTTWWEQTEPGAVTLQLNENIETVRDGLGSKLGMLIRGFSMYVSSIVFCLIVSWQLTLILVPIGPLTALTLGLSDKVNTKYSKKLGDMEEKAASTLEEVLLNVKTVQLCNAQEHFVKKYLELLHASLSSNLKSSTWIGVIEGFVLFQTAFLMALFLWTSMTMFFNASIAIAPGDILLILNTMTMSAYCFSLLGPHFSAVSKGRIAATAICEIIDNTPVSGTKSKPLENIKGHICFSNVRFKYSTREEEILRGLSWTAEPGQSIALVGESGCGKSTSLQILTRMYDASSDNVSIDGVDIKNICPSSLRKVTGVVEQRSCLITGTIAENIRFGRENVSDEEVKNAATMANAHEFIASMEKGYDTIVGDGGIMLSGGQKQRVAIARAILCNPKILLLDEATSALDTKSEKVVQEALNKASEGRTTVIVAHRLSTLKTVDRIFVLEKGVVTESGSHTELIEKDGYYARMVRAQDVDEGEDDYEKEDEKESEKSRLTERPVTLRRSRRSLRRPVDAEEMRLPAEEFEWNGQFATLFWKSLAGNYAKSIGSALLAFIRGLDIPTITLGYYFTFLALQKSSDTYQHYMWFAVGLVAGDGIVLFFVNTAMYTLSCWTSENVVNSIKTQSLRSLLYRPMSYFDSHSPSTCITTIIQKSPECKAMLDSTMGINFGGFVAVFVGLIISVIFVWEISVLATVLCCLAYIVFFAILHWSNVARHQKAKGERSAQMALEITENVRSVKIFAVEDYFVNRYGQELLIARKFERRIAFIEALNMSMTQSFIFLADLAFYSYASYLVYYGYYDIDTVFLSFLGAQLSGWAVVMTAPFFPDMIRALGSVKTIFKYIDDPHDIAKRLTSGETPEVNGAISFENVSFAYPSKRDVLVTKNMNFKSKSGEKIAFVGPSGGGKSTVLNLLTKLYSPTSGAVQIGDHDLNKISTMHFRRNLGVVGQEPVLFKGTILENITMGDETITLEMVKSACQTANAMKFINNLPENFETDVGDHGQRLSGGQRQRIAIARAIVRKPKVLLLDEATAALDAENEELVNQALAAATEHTTSITIAHRLKTIQQCDYIYFVEHGKVTESGTHKELMQGDGHYAALVNAQKLK